MKTMFILLTNVISVIAIVVFAAGSTVALLGLYEFAHTFGFIGEVGQQGTVERMAVSLLKAVDLFLIAIVLFVFAFGILVLFNNKLGKALPENMPEWMKIKSFIDLKVILWEAILTTLVISTLAYLAEIRLQGKSITFNDLAVPGAILLIAVSLYFLRKSEGGHA